MNCLLRMNLGLVFSILPTLSVAQTGGTAIPGFTDASTDTANSNLELQVGAENSEVTCASLNRAPDPRSGIRLIVRCSQNRTVLSRAEASCIYQSLERFSLAMRRPVNPDPSATPAGSSTPESLSQFFRSAPRNFLTRTLQIVSRPTPAANAAPPSGSVYVGPLHLTEHWTGTNWPHVIDALAPVRPTSAGGTIRVATPGTAPTAILRTESYTVPVVEQHHEMQPQDVPLVVPRGTVVSFRNPDRYRELVEGRAGPLRVEFEPSACNHLEDGMLGNERTDCLTGIRNDYERNRRELEAWRLRAINNCTAHLTHGCGGFTIQNPVRAGTILLAAAPGISEIRGDIFPSNDCQELGVTPNQDTCFNGSQTLTEDYRFPPMTRTVDRSVLVTRQVQTPRTRQVQSGAYRQDINLNGIVLTVPLFTGSDHNPHCGAPEESEILAHLNSAVESIRSVERTSSQSGIDRMLREAGQ